MKKLLGKLRQGLSIFAIFIGVIIVCGILYFLYEEILVRTLSKEVSLACNPVESSDSRIVNEHMNNGYIFKVNIAPNPERPFGDKIYDIMLLGKKDSDRNFIVNDSLEIIAAKKSKYKSFRQHAIGGYLDNVPEEVEFYQYDCCYLNSSVNHSDQHRSSFVVNAH